MAARKKAAKKKAGKKKVAKKRPGPRKPPRKAPRKRPKRGTHPPLKSTGWKPQEFTVILLADDQGPDQMVVKTSRNRRDIVRWVNQSSVTRTLTFKNSMWPFEGNPCDIVVPKGGQTGWYRIEKRPEEQGKFQYEYDSDPDFDPNGPPGDPVVDAGD